MNLRGQLGFVLVGMEAVALRRALQTSPLSSGKQDRVHTQVDDATADATAVALIVRRRCKALIAALTVVNIARPEITAVLSPLSRHTSPLANRRRQPTILTYRRRAWTARQFD